MSGSALQRTPPFPFRLENARRLRPDIHPATGPDAAQPAKLRTSPRCPTRPNGQNQNPESRSRWIEVGGNVTWYGLHVAERDYDRPHDLAAFLSVDGHRVGIQEIAFAAPNKQGVCRLMAKRARSIPYN